MTRYLRLDEFSPPPQGCVLSVGNFDGVHRGHAALVQRARQAAEWCDAPVVLATFDPHPLTLLAPAKAPPRLTTIDERAELLRSVGATTVIVLNTDWDLLNQTAEEFLRRIVERCRPRAFVEGPTFHFGRGRTGSVTTLREHAVRFGYEAIVLDEIECPELPGCPAINSSAIRDAIRSGQVDHAATMLGRPYRISGVVGSGQQRGASIGFPTANLTAIEHLLPRHAVYSAVAQLDDVSFHLAAVNLGPQPTFDQQTAAVEAHLIDFAGDLRGRRVGLHLCAWLRDQVKFNGVEELKNQLVRDVERARQAACVRDALRAGPHIAV
ncbi:MAG: riboflavin biosynthesis protein RibF [Phycisphaerae bacterium]